MSGVHARVCLPGICIHKHSSNDDGFMQFTALVAHTGGGKRLYLTHRYHDKMN